MEKQQEPKSYRPRIGITMGDFNGIGPEVIIKTLQDNRITNNCTIIVYGSGKILTRYKRVLNLEQFNYHQYNANSFINERKINVVNCWPEHIEIEPGKVTEQAGECAVQALQKAVEDLKNDLIDAVVTAPINKFNVQKPDFNFPGHTEFFTDAFEAKNSLMFLCAEDLRVGVVTGHIPLAQVAAKITKEAIIAKLKIMHQSLREDFGITKPKIAVLGLNPHAGEEGLLGREEIEIIHPAIDEARKHNILAFGAFAADGFFGTMQHKKYDAVLAMYHDQGLVPFKTLGFDKGVNFTAGLPIVRTSPDHGTAYNLAGKNLADENSFREALFLACEIVKTRKHKITRQLRVNHEFVNSNGE